MKAKEQIRKQEAGGMKFPCLHGHTKITLRNEKTGEVETYEKDNLVTNAIPLIFGNNVFGAKDYSQLAPLRDMLGGVMCFEDSLDASALEMPSDAANKLIAHAGQTAHSTANVLRGNPNGALSGEIQDGKGYKFVWDFATSQGNGTISALSLIHKIAGDIGLRPTEALTNESMLYDVTNKTKAYTPTTNYPTFDEALFCLLEVDLASGTGLHAYLPNTSGNTSLVLTEVVGNFKKQGINESIGDLEASDIHTITLTREFRARYSAITSDASFVYVATAGNSAGHSLYINKISKADWSVSALTITEASMNLGFFNDYENTASEYCPHKVCVSGGYIYWKDSTNRNFYKINLESPSDIVLLESFLEEDINIKRCGMISVAEGLIFGANFIINSDKVYPSQFSINNLKSATSNRSWIYRFPSLRFIKSSDGVWYQWSYENDADYSAVYYLSSGFPLNYLGTIQNLPSPITKTNDKTMQIEYSITLEEET